MSSKPSAFVKLKTPPHIHTTRPQHCSFNGNCIILNTEQSLKMYDLDKQMITKKWEPTANIAGTYYRIKGSCIDSKRNILYAVIGDRDFFGLLNKTQLVSVDLIKNEWNVLKWNNVTESQSIFFISSINKLYIKRPKNWRFKHLMPTKDDQYFYRNSTDQLFKKTQGEIIICDVCTDGKWLSDWNIFENKLPHKRSFDIEFQKFEIILAFDQILFLFDCPAFYKFSHKKACKIWTIWCLDLNHDKTWYQVRYEMPDFGAADVAPYSIKDDNNNVHLINFGAEKKNRYHFRASLVDLIPVEIIELNRKRTDPLVIGFVKKFEKRHKMIFLPMYLKKIIVKFCPVFV